MFSNRLWFAVSLLLALALAACGATPATTGTPAADIPIVVDSGRVIAEGRLEPVSFAQLSFLTGGQVAEVLVSEGTVVQTGDVLARLENREALQAQLAQAEQVVLESEQALKSLSDNAALLKAQTERELAQARDELEKAARRFKNVATPDIKFYEEELRKAQNALTTAQENAEITGIGDLENALQAARDRLKRATDIYNDAQKSQADCEGCEFVFAAAAGGFVKLEDARKEFVDATDAVKVLEFRLAQAQRSDAQTLSDLQERVDDAKANLAAARNPDPQDVALAQSEVDLNKARIADAERRLSNLRAGPDPDQLSAAEARLDTAKANLEAAKAALENTELRAPIGGTVSRVDLKVGEQVSPGAPVVTLGDFTQWVVKTNNLTEIEVVRLQDGQTAEVVLDALPDVTLTGKVTKIASVFVESRGDITYTVTVTLDQSDPRARWGMTAQVTFGQ
jgi:multidrug resistance efflux pump